MSKKWQRPGTTTELAYRYLERRITEGRLAPGVHIVEQDICRRLKLSRSPVREALRSLNMNGLVEFHRRRGARVTQITAQQVRSTFQVFEILEALATHLAAGSINADRGRRFQTLLARMREAVETRNVSAYFRLNARLHQVIYEAAGNEVLERLLLNLGKQIMRFRFVALTAPGRLERSLGEHRTLIATLRRGDALRAARLARSSVIHARDALLTRLGFESSSPGTSSLMTSPLSVAGITRRLEKIGSRRGVGTLLFIAPRTRSRVTAGR